MGHLWKSIIFVWTNIITLLYKDIKNKNTSFFQKILEDKRAIRKCIQEGGDVKKLAKERGIKFATPL